MTNNFMDKATLSKFFENQHTAFYQQPTSTYHHRFESLNRLKQLLLANKESLITAINADFGCHSQQETRIEIFLILNEIKYAQKRLKQWMKPKKRKVTWWLQPAYARLMPQPLGVVGIMVPWNVPINLTINPLIGALAAGNLAMIKLPELTPHTSELLKNLLAQYFTDNEVIAITGDAEVGKMFAALPFDHLLFTGSSTIGRSVMQAASQNLTPVTLELGGKSPVIIAEDVNLKRAVKKIILHKLVNAGQICESPDYVLLPSGFENQFITIAKKVIANYYPNIFKNTDYTNIINEKHLTRLQSYLDDAKEKGAEIIPLSHENNIISGRRMAPVLLKNVSKDMLVMQEEIFGPLLPIITYEKLQDAINFVNARSKPLALYYFGKDKQQINYVLQNTFAGGVTVNDIFLHYTQSSLPFGGAGMSGMGSYHGEYGFNTFSKLKPVLYQRRWDLTSMFFPPYGKVFNLFMKIFLR